MANKGSEVSTGDPKSEGSNPKSDEGGEEKTVRQSASEQIARFRRGALVARLEGIALVADAAGELVSRIAKDDRVTSSKTVGDLIRAIPDSVRPAIRDTANKMTEIPGKVTDKMHAEINREDQPAAVEESPTK
ncbi:MAG: hypothetical protein Q7T05_02795 [Dehalococcoidia bacterium]|nr:hypothetical protein [Dehalococcoidia bacterium]